MKGVPISARVIASDAVLPEGAGAVVFCGGDGPALDPLWQAAGEKGLITIGLVRAHAERFASVSVFDDGDRVKIAVRRGGRQRPLAYTGR